MKKGTKHIKEAREKISKTHTIQHTKFGGLI